MIQSKNLLPRCRLRDLGISIGNFPTGKFNAITDVKGVKVGQTTLIQGDGRITGKKAGPIRTGVTCILPGENIFQEYITAGSFILNGAGEVSGLTQVTEWGTLETPILLTNTFSVGTCSSAMIHHLTEKYPSLGLEQDVIIPIVGECDDSWLNNIAGSHLKQEHVISAMESAKTGPVQEGNVGGGTGMITCDFKGGIGTSSRKISMGNSFYTMGILVCSNFGDRKDLRIDGFPIGELLATKYKDITSRKDNYGSIIAVIATDCPMSSHQLNRLCKRAALGIGKVGSYAAHGSGEIILAFSTANKTHRDNRDSLDRIKSIPDKKMNLFYSSIIEATQEAIMNALCMGEDMYGINNHFSPALPLDDVKQIMTKYNTFKNSLYNDMVN